MADNYVQIKVKASDEAKPDLEALKFDLEAIGAKVETAKIGIDDKDANARLTGFEARLETLKKRAETNLNLAGASKVWADLARMDAALDHLNDKHADPKVALDGAAKVLAEVEGLDREIDKLNDKGSRAGPILDKLGSSLANFSVSLPMLGNVGLPALAALVPAAAALATELVGVVSGFAAAGAGAGAFALLAKPAVSQVTAAYSGLHAAQQKYASALALEKLDPTKGHASAVKGALDQLKLAQQAIGKLPASEQAAIKGLSDLSAEFGKMSKAFQPKAFEVFAAGLGLVKKLLPDIVPFASTFADVLTKLLEQASKFAGSKGFADWLKQFHSLEGPALNAIGHGIGQVAIAIGKLLTTMSGKDVAHAINIAFGGISGTINGLAGTVKFLMQLWDGAGIAARQFGHDVAAVFHGIANTFDTVRHGLADSAHSWASSFDHVRHDIAAKFDGIKGAIESKFAGAGAWLASAAHSIASSFDHVRHDIAAWFDGIKGDIESKFSGAGAWLLGVGRAIIQGLINGIESMMGSLGGVVGHVVGVIKSIAGALGIHSPSTVMHGYGVNIMDGLMGGIGSRMPDLRSQLGGVSSMVGGMGVPGGGRGGAIQLQVAPGGGSAFEQFMVASIRNWVRVKGGGSVQQAFGRT